MGLYRSSNWQDLTPAPREAGIDQNASESIRLPARWSCAMELFRHGDGRIAMGWPLAARMLKIAALFAPRLLRGQPRLWAQGYCAMPNFSSIHASSNARSFRAS